MRKIIIRGQWLVDLMLFNRDSYHLHLFFLAVLRGSKYLVRTLDVKVPMPLKAVKLSAIKGKEGK